MTDGMQQMMFNVAQCACLIFVIRIFRQCDMRMFERFDQGEPAFMVEFMRDPSRIKARAETPVIKMMSVVSQRILFEKNL